MHAAPDNRIWRRSFPRYGRGGGLMRRARRRLILVSRCHGAPRVGPVKNDLGALRALEWPFPVAVPALGEAVELGVANSPTGATPPQSRQPMWRAGSPTGVSI